MDLELTVNGDRRLVAPAPGETLLDVLRARFGLLSPKRGCSPAGQCGSCLVLLDGEPQVACTVPAEGAAGRAVTTLEGLPEPERARFAEAFAAAGAVQCGFCLPGIVLRAHHLLAQDPRPTRAAIAAALDAHLCRCTGYVKILDAIERVAAMRRGERGSEAPPTGGVGARLERHGAREQVLGTRPFVDDLAPPGLLHGAVTLSPHARARVLGIDTAAARAHPGVVAVADRRGRARRALEGTPVRRLARVRGRRRGGPLRRRRARRGRRRERDSPRAPRRSWSPSSTRSSSPSSLPTTPCARTRPGSTPCTRTCCRAR